MAIGRISIWNFQTDRTAAGCRARLGLGAGRPVGPADIRAASWTGVIGCPFAASSRGSPSDVGFRRDM